MDGPIRREMWAASCCQETGEILRCTGRESKDPTQRGAFRHHQKLRKPKEESNMPRKLCVNGESVSDPEKLLNTWADHFRSLAKSKCDQCSDLQELHQRMDSLALSSMFK